MAALLAIARRSKSAVSEEEEAEEITEDLGDGWLSIQSVGDDNGLNKLVLFVEIKKQVEILREGMDEGKEKTLSGVQVSYAADVEDFAVWQL